MGDSEVLLVDKPVGLSSFGVVGRVRWALSQKASAIAGEKRKVKVGHTGTLDPFATGLLILLVGKGTKRAGEFLKLDKEYVAELCLGKVSTTGDPEGEISNYVSVGDSPTEDVVRNLLQTQFVGTITQTPPVYSAIKINGQRAYKLARAGKQVEMPSREVTIYEIESLEYEWPRLVLRVKCSSGTYIRSLAVDIGEALGVGAYLTGLRRTRVGEYRVEDAKALDFFDNL